MGDVEALGGEDGADGGGIRNHHGEEPVAVGGEVRGYKLEVLVLVWLRSAVRSQKVRSELSGITLVE